MKALVTGGSGHVASALLRSMAGDSGWQLRAAVRAVPPLSKTAWEYVQVGDLSAATASVRGIASGCEVVVHTAARVHAMDEKSLDFEICRRTNVDGTLRIAREAAQSGVRRFVFISTVKVNGERTEAGQAFAEDDVPNPHGPYATSKWEAECALQQLCADTGMEYVIIRPPLVYGPGMRANFHALARAVRRGLPLPLGAVRNLRSFVALDNLVDFIRVCMDHPAVPNGTFLVSDGHDISTPELVRSMAAALGRRAQLLSVPGWVLQAMGFLAGRQTAIQRLTQNLQVDIGKARRVLGWQPPVTVEAALQRTMLDLRDS